MVLERKSGAIKSEMKEYSSCEGAYPVDCMQQIFQIMRAWYSIRNASPNSLEEVIERLNFEEVVETRELFDLDRPCDC